MNNFLKMILQIDLFVKRKEKKKRDQTQCKLYNHHTFFNNLISILN